MDGCFTWNFSKFGLVRYFRPLIIAELKWLSTRFSSSIKSISSCEQVNLERKWLLTSTNRHWCCRIYFVDSCSLAIVWSKHSTHHMNVLKPLEHVCRLTVLCVQELKENNIPLENVRICYSPFSRTTHTAKIVASVLNLLFEGPQCKVGYSTHPLKDISYWD